MSLIPRKWPYDKIDWRVASKRELDHACKMIYIIVGRYLGSAKEGRYHADSFRSSVELLQKYWDIDAC